MNIKIKPPCICKHKGKIVKLRAVEYANARMKKNGWSGLVAYIQDYSGSGTMLVRYKSLQKIKN
jgi:hypothetical protein